MAYWRSERLEAARALAAKDWSNPKVIVAVRTMIRDGMTMPQIAETLGWHPSTFYGRMKRVGLAMPIASRAHRGIETTLPHADCGISAKPYKPRTVTV